MSEYWSDGRIRDRYREHNQKNGNTKYVSMYNVAIEMRDDLENYIEKLVELGNEKSGRISDLKEENIDLRELHVGLMERIKDAEKENKRLHMMLIDTLRASLDFNEENRKLISLFPSEEAYKGLRLGMSYALDIVRVMSYGDEECLHRAVEWLDTLEREADAINKESEDDGQGNRDLDEATERD